MATSVSLVPPLPLARRPTSGLRNRPVSTVPRGFGTRPNRVVVSLNHCHGPFPARVLGKSYRGIVHDACTHRCVCAGRHGWRSGGSVTVAFLGSHNHVTGKCVYGPQTVSSYRRLRHRRAPTQGRTREGERGGVEGCKGRRVGKIKKGKVKEQKGQRTTDTETGEEENRGRRRGEGNKG